MSKISQYAQNTSPALTDYLIGVQASGPTTKRLVLSDLLTLFLNNIPATEGSFGFVSTGLVWSADSVGVTRAASMTSGRIKVNTTFLAISAVTGRVFTASKDTYIDILDNLDGTGTIVYTEVTNNAASPALASNSMRIGIIVTGATTIAATGSINQGQETKILPIASSIPYQVTDSIGNLICPRDANRTLLGHRRRTTDFTTASATPVSITELSVPVIVPTGRKTRAILFTPRLINDTASGFSTVEIYDGTVGGAGIIADATMQASGAGQQIPTTAERIYTPSTTSVTFNAAAYRQVTGTANFTAGNGASHLAVFLT